MKILLVDTIHPVFNELVAEHGYTCEDGSAWSKEQVLERIRNYAGLVIRSRFTIDRPFLEHAAGLRFIARAGAGMENIDVAYAESKGIRCLHAPEGNRNAVAEHALGMLLALLNNLVRADREVRKGAWNRESNRGLELDGRTVGIIGFGNTGSSFAGKLSGFDVTILAFDKYLTIDKRSFPHVSQVSQEALMEQADIISLHVPLTVETEHLVDRAFLKKLARKPILINTSRGRVVSTADLAWALERGLVSGACLDVFDFEDSSFEQADPAHSGAFERLKKSDRVVLSPHIAGWTAESHARISRVLAGKVAAAGPKPP